MFSVSPAPGEGGYLSPMFFPRSLVPGPGGGGGTPVLDKTGVGYPPARTGVGFPQDRTGIPPGKDRTGVHPQTVCAAGCMPRAVSRRVTFLLKLVLGESTTVQMKDKILDKQYPSILPFHFF